MLRKTRSIRAPVKREGAERYIFLSLVSFAISVIFTRAYLEMTGYPQIGNGTLHIAHVLWGGLLLFIASLLPLIFANRWMLNLSACLSGVGVGLFIDEVGKFITQTNDYFYPPAAPIIYAFFLLTVLLYLTVRRPEIHTPRGMMYRVLEDLTEVLDRDLEPRERASLDARLHQISSESADENLRQLAADLDQFLDNKQLVLARRKPNVYQRLGRRIAPYFTRVLTRPRLKTFIVFALGAMGVLGLIDFGRLALAVPAPGPALETLLTPMVSHGRLLSAQQALWYLIRTGLEGVTGLVLIVSGGLIASRRERFGVQLGMLGLITWIAVVNLLVYYFDQFGAVVTTLFQFFVLTILTYYRRFFLRLAWDASAASGPIDRSKSVLPAHEEAAMAENKTIPSEQSVEQFLNAIEDERKRKDSFTLLELMRQATGMEPKMWGSSIVGFGSYHYKYDSGREGDTMLLGFSPRKQNLTIYNMGGFETYDDLLKKLGKHSTGKGCLYIKRLEDVDLETLKSLMEESFNYAKEKHSA